MAWQDYSGPFLWQAEWHFHHDSLLLLTLSLASLKVNFSVIQSIYEIGINKVNILNIFKITQCDFLLFSPLLWTFKSRNIKKNCATCWTCPSWDMPVNVTSNKAQQVSLPFVMVMVLWYCQLWRLVCQDREVTDTWCRPFRPKSDVLLIFCSFFCSVHF